MESLILTLEEDGKHKKMSTFTDFSLSLLSFKAETPPQKSAFFYEMCISVCNLSLNIPQSCV